MTLARGTVTVRRYTCKHDPSPDSARELVELLEADRYRGKLLDSHKEERSGWVSQQNFLETDFSVESSYQPPYLLFALRTDRKAIPPALMRALADKRTRVMLSEMGLVKLPPGIKDEIRDDIESEYLPKILPTIQVVEVCWNLVTGDVQIGSAAEKAVGRVCKQFSATFSRTLLPVNPARLALEQDGPAREARLATLAATDLAFGDAGEGRTP